MPSPIGANSAAIAQRHLGHNVQFKALDINSVLMGSFERIVSWRPPFQYIIRHTRFLNGGTYFRGDLAVPVPSIDWMKCCQCRVDIISSNT